MALCEPASKSPCKDSWQVFDESLKIETNKDLKSTKYLCSEDEDSSEGIISKVKVQVGDGEYGMTIMDLPQER